MRSPVRRLFAVLGVFAIGSVLSMLAPSPAYANECYWVTVGGQGVMVCP